VGPETGEQVSHPEEADALRGGAHPIIFTLVAHPSLGTRMTPPSAPRALGTATRFLVAALMLGAIALVMRLRAAEGRASMEEMMALVEPGGSASGPACTPAPACGPQIMSEIPGPTVVGRAQACRDAAYLCDGFEARGRMRALRWGDRHPPIRIRVRWPDNVARADQMNSRHQQGAVRGLRAWSGVPIQLVVEPEPSPTDDNPWTETPASDARPLVRGNARRATVAAQPDFVVEWQIAPYTSELGEGYTTWGSDGVNGGYGTRVTAARLSRAPDARADYLTDRQVEAAAAHMMGHLLGLPHSSSPADVMYPGNTALTPSADDRRAIAALYALPNGAVIQDAP
jgi:hypothetical protein